MIKKDFILEITDIKLDSSDWRIKIIFLATVSGPIWEEGWYGMKDFDAGAQAMIKEKAETLLPSSFFKMTIENFYY